jgi:hypothetical protein
VFFIKEMTKNVSQINTGSAVRGKITAQNYVLNTESLKQRRVLGEELDDNGTSSEENPKLSLCPLVLQCGLLTLVQNY